MFDKRIESDTADAEFKNRSRYFMISSVVVGILFLTAVVYSLYAAEVGLGNSNFDITELIAPLETTEPENNIEPERSRPQTSRQSSDRPTRQLLMEPTETSTRIPPSISTTANPYLTTRADRFTDFDLTGIDRDGSAGVRPPLDLPQELQAASQILTVLTRTNPTDLHRRRSS